MDFDGLRFGRLSNYAIYRVNGETFWVLRHPLERLSTEKNKHVEGLFHQYFEGLFKDI
jgi:hypothetical protein